MIISFKKSSEELLWKKFPALGTFVDALTTSDTTDTQASTCEVAGNTVNKNEYGLSTIDYKTGARTWHTATTAPTSTTYAGDKLVFYLDPLKSDGPFALSANTDISSIKITHGGTAYTLTQLWKNTKVHRYYYNVLTVAISTSFTITLGNFQNPHIF
jgi:hypothetical protein